MRVASTLVCYSGAKILFIISFHCKQKRVLVISTEQFLSLLIPGLSIHQAPLWELPPSLRYRGPEISSTTSKPPSGGGDTPTSSKVKPTTPAKGTPKAATTPKSAKKTPKSE